MAADIVDVNLRTGVIAIVLAAAGGAAVARTFVAPSRAPVLDIAAAPSLPSDAALAAARGGRRSAAPASARLSSVVYVAGEVVRPGVYRLSTGARNVDALHLAGGPTKAADLVAVNLAAPVEDGAEIVVPPRGAPGTSVVSGSATRSRGMHARVAHAPRRSRATTRHRRKRAVPDDVAVSGGDPAATIDVNRADAASLETLPGIGPALAARIVNFREVNGTFASTDELLDVAGMTQSKVDELAPYVTF